MAWYHWVIVGLLVLSYFQYSSPEKTNELLDPVWGKVREFINNKNPLQRDSNSESSGAITCPDITEYVCGDDGTTYKNSCEAALAGILEVTPGEC